MTRPAQAAVRPRIRILPAAALLVIATLLAYANSFGGPFVFDDYSSIQTNASIRDLGDLGTVLFPPPAETVGGRPLVNLSLAINYAIGGLDVTGYHAVNLLIHLLAGLVLFGVIRRTLVRIRGDETIVALPAAIALLWMLHPLQTESVTYVVQRAEAMVSLAWLLTLYGAIRAIEAPAEKWWPWCAVTACAAGMLCKEVMVSAPLMVLLYDRAFAAGTLRDAWRLRRGLHAGLWATLLLLAAMVLLDGRGGTAGFDTPMRVSAYALTQAGAIVHYLRLVVWPHPLVFDYGTPLVSPGEVAGQLGLVLVLVGLTAYACWRHPRTGWVALAAWALIAPSSSVVPIATQTIAEHRIYLALGGVLVLAVLGLERFIGARVLPLCAVWAAALGVTTWFRNRDYATEVALWQSVTAAVPTNARAHHNLGKALAVAGRHREALDAYRAAVRIDPALLAARNDLTGALQALDQLETPGGTAAYEAALRAHPDSVELHVTLGRLLAFMQKPAEAAEHFARALKIRPDQADIENELGKAYGRMGQPDEAIRHFERALAIDPAFAEAKSNIEIARRMKTRGQ